MSYPDLKSAKILSADKSIFPIFREPKHWSMIVLDNVTKTIMYIDSLGLSGEKYIKVLKSFIHHKVKEEKTIYDPTALSEVTIDGPMQANGVDCGVFVMANSRIILKSEKITKHSYRQQDMNDFRKIFAFELIKGALT